MHMYSNSFCGKLHWTEIGAASANWDGSMCDRKELDLNRFVNGQESFRIGPNISKLVWLYGFFVESTVFGVDSLARVSLWFTLQQNFLNRDAFFTALYSIAI